VEGREREGKRGILLELLPVGERIDGRERKK
jgi:hypothetical protein